MAIIYATASWKHDEIVLFNVHTVFSGPWDIYVVRDYNLNKTKSNLLKLTMIVNRPQVSRLFNKNARPRRFGSDIMQCRQ